MSPRGQSLLVRIGIAVALVIGLVVYVRSRSSSADDHRSGGGGSGGPGGSSTGGSGGGGDGSARGSDAPSAGSGADRVVPVKAAPVVKQDVPIWLEGLGSVAAFMQVTVHTQVDGRLDKVLFIEGQPVKANQVIAQIDPRPFAVQLHTAQGALARDTAQHKDALASMERQKSLHDQNLVAQQAVDDATAQAGEAEGAMTIDRASIENAQLQLDYAQIKSPIDGVAGVRLVDPGNIVHAADATGIVVITQIDQVAVYFSVAEDDLPQINAAMAAGTVPVEVRSRDGQTLLGTGTAAALDNQINAATATLRVKAIVANPTRVFLPNQFVKARMLVDTLKGATVVPAVAVQRGPQGAYLYVVEQGAAKMLPIEAGQQIGESIVVKKGVAPGAQVVIEGANQLRPGAKVVVQGENGGAGGGGAGSGDASSGASGKSGGSGKGHGKGKGSGQ